MNRHDGNGNKVLVINPNSNVSMTESLRPILDSVRLDRIPYELFTAPSGPRSINNDADAELSAQICLEAVREIAVGYSGFVVACYSAHPLVFALRHEWPDKLVVGIFEASIATAMTLCGHASRSSSSSLAATMPHSPPDKSILKFGIVTTGKAWESLLTDATMSFLGLKREQDGHQGASFSSDSNHQPSILGGQFAGVESTGFNADELHNAPRPILNERLGQAVARLQDRSSSSTSRLAAVILGCAGMSELEDVVRRHVDESVRIIDAVKAGYCSLTSLMLMQDIG